jgi:hypothetical protein
MNLTKLEKNTLFNTGPLEWKDQHLNIVHTSVACAVGPLQNTETQHVNIVLQCKYQFFEQPNMKGNHA